MAALQRHTCILHYIATHIRHLCRDSFYQLRQLRTVIRSLTSESIATLSYPCLHYSPTRLLQLTLCWPSIWAVTVPRQGPAHCRTPLWAHSKIWPRFQVYAGCAPLAPPPTEDFVPYNFLSLAVPPGSCSRLSFR